MTRYFYKSLLIFVLVFSTVCSFGQSLIKDDLIKNDSKISSLKFGVNYLSNSVFMGRSDTVRIPVITPNIKYTFRSGIFVAGSLDYLPNSKSKELASGDLSAGYDFDLTDNLDGSVSFTKSFYNTKSPLIASSQSALVNVSLNYDFGKIITPSLSADYVFNKQGDKNDIFLSASLSHAFIATSLFNAKDILIISPAATLNTGTQNFYDSFLVNKKGKNEAKTASLNKLMAAKRDDLAKFKVLDYEFSVPVEYKIKHFIFTLTPTYSIAQNKLPEDISTELSNKSKLFNLEMGIALKF
ncbi:MAG: hypothetical protein P0Y49_10125 [Candidatus Pedobacter colombiensis]|uniref:Uncharacterized protein n=1 Tax=Candidatus Pedobacter colombiensis TaxID=3121371 RepID=A0AAJ5WCG5_9SPHI|nr:hypothetical protein [Pedobacter sp.]WEK21493.1 MAG: hypothetical protein P0Y49_10125 [Pedobacter sp.]